MTSVVRYLLVSAVIFSSFVNAQITTSIWLPGAATANQSFVGSVLTQTGDRTILSLAYAGQTIDSELFSSAPNTVTVAGGTFAAYTVSASDPAGDINAAVTINLECSRGGTIAAPTCTMSTLNANRIVSELCAGLASVTGLDSQPEYCTNSSVPTFEQTVTLGGDSQSVVNNFQVIITAGGDKLTAAVAAATPTAAGATATNGALGALKEPASTVASVAKQNNAVTLNGIRGISCVVGSITALLF